MFGESQLIQDLAPYWDIALVLEPMRWFDMYEWRPMTQLEKVAIYVYWKELAARLGMTDVPPTLEAFQQCKSERWTISAAFAMWTSWHSDVYLGQTEYLAVNVYPCPSNKAVAEGTLGLITLQVPWFLKSFVRSAVISVMEDNIRLGMGLEKPPVWISRTVYGLFMTRRFIVRHLCLPRFSEVDVMPKIDENGRMHRTFWTFEPWYVYTQTDRMAQLLQS